MYISFKNFKNFYIIFRQQQFYVKYVKIKGIKWGLNELAMKLLFTAKNSKAYYYTQVQ